MPRLARIFIGIGPLAALLAAQKFGAWLDGKAGHSFDRLENWINRGGGKAP